MSVWSLDMDLVGYRPVAPAGIFQKLTKDSHERSVTDNVQVSLRGVKIKTYCTDCTEIDGVYSVVRTSKKLIK